MIKQEPSFILIVCSQKKKLEKNPFKKIPKKDQRKMDQK